MNRSIRSSVRHRLFIAGGILLGLATTSLTRAYDLLGNYWEPGDVTFHVNLDGTDSAPITGQLFDGTMNWVTSFDAALADWNAHLVSIQLVSADEVEELDFPNGRNETAFTTDVYGEEWGEGVLGVTLILPGETDILFNRSDQIIWNSYRGRSRANSTDFRRVALHELGHAIGLSHPDQAVPAQDVEAIMNSSVSDIDVLQPDDIDGASVLYDGTLTTPTITQPLQSLTVNVGDWVSFESEVNGSAAALDDPLISYGWYFPATDFNSYLFTFQNPVLELGEAQLYDAGTYTFIAGNPAGEVESAATLTVNPVALSTETKMANLSTRAFAGNGTAALTMGFVITGTEPKRILVRAVGPTLQESPFNLESSHANPRLRIVRSDGELLFVNDDWSDNSDATPSEINQATAALGGFSLPENSLDAVLLVTLEPGIYTATVDGPNAEEGVVIVEAYDADIVASDSRLVNLSTRGFVGTGAEIMIAGLVVSGPGPRTYLIRALGDTLGDFGINDFLDDTFIKIIRGSDVIRSSDDWDDPFYHQDMLSASMEKLGAIPLTDRQESAIQITLSPGVYSVQVSGFGDLTGIALVEIYEFPDS